VDILPSYIRQSLRRQKDISELLEVVLDLGRTPQARFLNREVVLGSKEVDEVDIDYSQPQGAYHRADLPCG